MKIRNLFSLLMGAMLLFTAFFTSACNKEDDSAPAGNLEVMLVNAASSVQEFLPDGCATDAGFSATTGEPCASYGVGEFIVVLTAKTLDGTVEYLPNKAASYTDSEAHTVSVYRNGELISESVPVEFKPVDDEVKPTPAGNIKVTGDGVLLVVIVTIDNSYLDEPGMYSIKVTQIISSKKDGVTFENKARLPDNLITESEYLK